MSQNPDSNSHSVLFSVKDLSISYLARRGRVRAVSNVSFDLHTGETLAVIGESGCGKSTLNLGLIRLLPATGVIDRGAIHYTGRDGAVIDVRALGDNQLRRFRWAECAMVSQAALNSLNPVIRIRDMVYDTAAAHGDTAHSRVRSRALELFRLVRLDPDRVFNAYPHELSGGMRQRVLLALGVLLNPQIVILDEPTTAVDILTQRTIIEALKDLREAMGFSIIFISHDLSIAAEMADTVATMYAGEIVEMGPVNEIFYQPRHAYTYGLLEAVPRLSAGAEELISIPGSPPDLIEPPPGCKFHPRCAFAVERCRVEAPPLVEAAPGHRVACFESARVLAQSTGRKVIPVSEAAPAAATQHAAKPETPLVELAHVYRSFRSGRTRIPVLQDINLWVGESEVLCLVGESGCGKTTTGKIMIGLFPPSEGDVLYRGKPLDDYEGKALGEARRALQIIHQDPFASLNPGHTVGQILSFPLTRHRMAQERGGVRRRIWELLTQVDLTPPGDIVDKFPHQLSGGQRQRVSVARALTVNPQLIVADEAVSMVDVSIRVSLLKMLRRLRDEYGISIVFITHDLALAKYFAWEGRIAVMYLGRVVEVGPTPTMIANPAHPYTRALISAIPEADPEITRNKPRMALRSEDIPSLLEIPRGCTFHPRCPFFVAGLCDAEAPPLAAAPGWSQSVACWPLARGEELRPYEPSHEP